MFESFGNKDWQYLASTFWILDGSCGMSIRFQQKLISRTFNCKDPLMHTGRDANSSCDTFKYSNFGNISRIMWRSSHDRLALLKYSSLKFGQPFSIEWLTLNLLNGSPSLEHSSTFSVISFGNDIKLFDRYLSCLQVDMSTYSSPVSLPIDKWIFNGLSIFLITSGKCSSLVQKLNESTWEMENTFLAQSFLAWCTLMHLNIQGWTYIFQRVHETLPTDGICQVSILLNFLLQTDQVFVLSIDNGRDWWTSNLQISVKYKKLTTISSIFDHVKY